MNKNTPKAKRKYVVCHNNLRWSIVNHEELDARLKAEEFTHRDKIFALGRKIRIKKNE